ncbi:hypothetical protein CHS0354_041119 [Potamilus streckersoni]|uniref:IRS-type PTB domain-containing protein n=1 Tax=Potamilus streckersoni TaxID=2493646 RepID=A0AAE0SDS4_9BIVA|nr:hypothetical protein CHS0354_041119 [Potamilus streckersoni]
MIINCFHCSSKIDDSCKFCYQCGNPPQSKICSKCKAQCSQDFKFCPQCGTPVSVTTGPSRQAMSFCFDITIEENDAAKRCHLKGKYVIHVIDTSIDLLDSRQNVVYSWPSAYVRRYGVDNNNNMFVIDVGRQSDSGEGQFRFWTRKAQEIHDLIRCRFTQSHNHIPTFDPILTQGAANQQRSSILDESERSIQIPRREQSTASSSTTDGVDNSLKVMGSCFDITIEENDSAKRCHLKGKYVIYVSATGICLLDSRHNAIYSWPYAYIRRYGVEYNQNVFVIEVGRKCDSGEGHFRFRTYKAQEIQDLIQCHSIKLLKSHSSIPTVAPIHGQEVVNRQGSTTSDESERSIQLPKREQSTVSSCTTDGTNNSLGALSHCFDITINENDAAKRCHLKGNYIIHLSAIGIGLLDARQNVVCSWPYAYIRRYGVDNNKNMLVIDVGRKSDSGEGQFRFQTCKAQVIHDLIYGHSIKLLESHNHILTVAPFLTQDVASRQRPSILEESEKSLHSQKNHQRAVSSFSIDGTDNSLRGTKSDDRNISQSCGKSSITVNNPQQLYSEPIEPGESGHPLVLPEENTFRQEALKKFGVEKIYKENYMNIKSTWEVQRQADDGPPLPPRPSNSDDDDDDSTYAGLCSYYNELKFERKALENWKIKRASQSHGTATGLNDPLSEQRYDNLRKGSETEMAEDQDVDKGISEEDGHELVNPKRSEPKPLL